MMHVFVTGGTGFIGGYLVEHLIREGHEVTALVRDEARAHDLEAMGAQLAKGDITDKASMQAPMAEADAVYHLAAWYKIGRRAPEVAEAVNVQGTRNVLELVDALDIDKAVYTSTLAVNSDTEGQVVDESYRFDGEHLSLYDRTKWEAHHKVALPMIEEGLPLVIVMPGVTYGPGDTSAIATLWRDHLTGDLPAVPKQVAYCWGHVEETAQAHRLAMDKGTPGETYIIAGEPRTLEEVMGIVAGITGQPPPKALPPWVFKALAQGARVANRFTDLPPAYHPETLRVMAGATYLGDNSKAEAELGLEHRDLATGLQETLEHASEVLARGGG